MPSHTQVTPPLFDESILYTPNSTNSPYIEYSFHPSEAGHAPQHKSPASADALDDASAQAPLLGILTQLKTTLSPHNASSELNTALNDTIRALIKTINAIQSAATHTQTVRRVPPAPFLQPSLTREIKKIINGNHVARDIRCFEQRVNPAKILHNLRRTLKNSIGLTANYNGNINLFALINQGVQLASFILIVRCFLVGREFKKKGRRSNKTFMHLQQLAMESFVPLVELLKDCFHHGAYLEVKALIVISSHLQSETMKHSYLLEQNLFYSLNTALTDLFKPWPTSGESKLMPMLSILLQGHQLTATNSTPLGMAIVLGSIRSRDDDAPNYLSSEMIKYLITMGQIRLVSKQVRHLIGGVDAAGKLKNGPTIPPKHAKLVQLLRQHLSHLDQLKASLGKDKPKDMAIQIYPAEHKPETPEPQHCFGTARFEAPAFQTPKPIRIQLTPYAHRNIGNALPEIVRRSAESATKRHERESLVYRGNIARRRRDKAIAPRRLMFSPPGSTTASSPAVYGVSDTVLNCAARSAERRQKGQIPLGGASPVSACKTRLTGDTPPPLSTAMGTPQASTTPNTTRRAHTTLIGRKKPWTPASSRPATPLTPWVYNF